MDSKGQIYDSKPEKAPADAFPVLKEEQMLLEKMPMEHRMEYLINLRFKVWLAYNKLKPDAITKIKMRNAFEAGFMARHGVKSDKT